MQYQNEVNDIRAERIAKSANPLALLAAAQPYSDNYYQAPKPQRTNTTSSSTRPSSIYQHTAKRIRPNQVTPHLSHVRRNMILNKLRGIRICKRIWHSLQSISKGSTNLPTTTFELLQTPGTGLKIPHQAKGVPLQAEQANWLADTDEEIDEQELEAHYSFMAKIQEVLPEESSSTEQPLEQVQNNDENNVFANKRQHSERNAAECTDERVALVNLIANLTLDTEENKMILKQLKKANASLTQELKECRTNLDETGRALGEATSCQDSCLIALQNKQNEFKKYIAFNDQTIDYEILQTKLNETLGLLARKDIYIKEGLKTKAYEISVVNQKHDELVKRSLLTKSQFEGQLKEKTKVISDLKVKEEKDIDKMIEMDKQLKFLNEIVYTRNQSIQTIHMLAPKCSTYNGRPTFANPMYLKKAQSDTPFKECECLAQKLSKQTESVNKEVHNKLLKSFAKLENHSISLELALQQCKEQMKNNSVCKENGSNVFRKEREQYHEIHDLKAQMQDKNIAIGELKKLIEKCKGKSVETQFNKPYVVRQPNAQRIPKPSVLGKPTPFSNSP
ncbi:hypothetical protein Tco_1408238 [Tanacetum coccineum]